MSDIDTIQNTIIEHSVATEEAVVDVIYETSEVVLSQIDQLRNEIRTTDASVERLADAIDRMTNRLTDLLHNIRLDNARDNARQSRDEMQDMRNLISDLDLETKTASKQKPEPVQDRLRRLARSIGY